MAKPNAAEFDPQPFHLDEAAAEKTIFKGLAASGWQAKFSVYLLRTRIARMMLRKS